MQINLKLLLLLLFVSPSVLGLSDVNFDHSNGLDLLKKYSAGYLDPNADKELSLLRANYERLKPSKVLLGSKPIIPKIVHQIWLGNAEIPKNYQYFLETWKQYNPDWEIKVWTIEDVLKEKFPNMDLFYLSRSHAEQSDIIRYEIIRRYGGVYVDTDVECFTNFDVLNYRYDFYVNMEPPALNKKRVTIANNMIASVPNHYILTQALDNIRENWDKAEELFEEKYSNSWTSFKRSVHHLAVQRTMYPLSDAVMNFLETQDQAEYKSIVLPASYNIPMYVVNNTPIINFLSNSFRGRAKLSNKIEIRPETMSFHFYDKQNSLMSQSDFSTSIFNKSKIEGFFYKLLKFRDKYYLAFRDLYKHNYPTEVQYNVQPMIPKVIYLDSDKLSQQELAFLEKQWQIMNPYFKIQPLSYEYLQQFIPEELKDLQSDAIKIIACFYLLQKEGGVFIESGFKPAKLKEFNYKYSYYGMFKNLSKIFSQLKLNTGIIASAPDHAMLNRLLKNIESEAKNNSHLNRKEIEKIYLENAYKYYQLDGKSIILPEDIFNQKR